MDDKKKITAALSAVLHFIRTEQEALTAHASPLPTVQRPSPVSTCGPERPYNPWGMSGRQTQMQIRDLMLMRTFKNTR